MSGVLVRPVTDNPEDWEVYRDYLFDIGDERYERAGHIAQILRLTGGKLYLAKELKMECYPFLKNRDVVVTLCRKPDTAYGRRLIRHFVLSFVNEDYPAVEDLFWTARCRSKEVHKPFSVLDWGWMDELPSELVARFWEKMVKIVNVRKGRSR